MMNINEIPEYFCLIVTEVKKFAVYGIRPGSIIYCRKSFRKNDDGIYVYYKNGKFELSSNPIEGYVQVGKLISVINNRRNSYGTQKSIC